MSAPTRDTERYRPRPTVMDVFRSPKLLTKEVLAGMVVGLALIPGGHRVRDRRRRAGRGGLVLIDRDGDLDRVPRWAARDDYRGDRGDRARLSGGSPTSTVSTTSSLP